jgi:hypothetical protein
MSQDRWCHSAGQKVQGFGRRRKVAVDETDAGIRLGSGLAKLIAGIKFGAKTNVYVALLGLVEGRLADHAVVG